MKTSHKMKVLAAASAAALLLSGSAQPPMPPGVECEYVFSGGGWIGFCTETDPETPIENFSRISGGDRYETSALISQQSFEPGVPVVYIANGQTLVDAVGAGAATKGEGPVLMVPASGTLPAAIATELARLDPLSIVVVGSEASVSATMAAQVTLAAQQ